MSLMHLVQSRPSVRPSATVEETVQLMAKANVGAILVMDGDKLLGIFTERDLMKRLVLPRLDPARTAVSEVMTSPVQTIRGSTSVEEAATIMQSRRFRHLAVVDEAGSLLGMIALRYLLFDRMGSLERKVDDLEAFIMTDGPGG